MIHARGHSRAIKQACAKLGITEQRPIEAIFHDNAARLIAGIVERKQKRLRKAKP
jgi:hypothetical protein